VTISQPDFVELLPFSNKIEEWQLTAFIEQARTFDLLPVLGYEALEALDGLTLPTLLTLTTGPAVPGGCYVRRDRVYKALTAATAPIPTTGDTDDWAHQPLMTLWRYYVRPYWVQRAFARFVVTHGLNITKAGVTLPKDGALNTYERPSAGQIATLQASIDNTADTLLSRLTHFLGEEKLYPAATCAAPAHRHRRPIRGINR
jgi:hypothetical protein